MDWKRKEMMAEDGSPVFEMPKPDAAWNCMYFVTIFLTMVFYNIFITMAF